MCLKLWDVNSRSHKCIWWWNDKRHCRLSMSSQEIRIPKLYSTAIVFKQYHRKRHPPERWLTVALLVYEVDCNHPLVKTRGDFGSLFPRGSFWSIHVIWVSKILSSLHMIKSWLCLKICPFDQRGRNSLPRICLRDLAVKLSHLLTLLRCEWITI